LNKAILGVVTLVLLMIAAVAVLPGYRPKSHPFFAHQMNNQVDVLAHGAGQGVAPTNTLLALKTANASNARILEVDVQLTRDNVLVLHHDDTLDRTTDLTGPVSALTWAQIAAADQGSEVIIEGARFGGDDTKVTRLDVALAAFPVARWNIEIKNDNVIAAKQLCDIITVRQLTDSVLVASFHKVAMDAFRRLCPEVATSMTPDEIRLFLLASKVGLSRFVATPAVAIQIPVEGGGFDLTNARFIAALKRRNIKLHFWTINEAKQMRELIDAGADGLLTDYVVRANEVVAKSRR
jgi:glycerophosphoryl diester phosphodiesterase